MATRLVAGSVCVDVCERRHQMFFHPWLVVQLALFVGAILWCKAIFERLPADIDELYAPIDFPRKAVIVFFWVLTLPILVMLISAGWSVLRLFAVFVK